MSDPIRHKCGIALIRLRKPLDHYYKKYGSYLYGLNKLYLLMEKQHNRGQDGAGLATIKLDVPPGEKYISTYRTNESQPIDKTFEQVEEAVKERQKASPQQIEDHQWWKQNIEFIGELLLGHLRYGTYGKYDLENCHPVIRENNWLSRNLVLAGNFNITNINELFETLLEIGQHPIEDTDTLTLLEKVGHFLDEENKTLFKHYREQNEDRKTIAERIEYELNIPRILYRSFKKVDGGYTIAGMIGHGDAFVIRDPAGIRPAYFYEDEEVIVAASERPAIQTTFNVPAEEVEEVRPGHALIMNKEGKAAQRKCLEPTEKTPCSFERIYFSRGSDPDIYQERKQLGYYLTPKVLKAIEENLEDTVFSYIPNTAEVAFIGLIEGITHFLDDYKKDKIRQEDLEDDQLKELLALRPRIEKIAIKDAKLRTFITKDSGRDDLVAHIYDVSYGTVRKGVDTLVILDDSIVRGTTLQESILSILDRLGPKKIVVVSSAPQIRYPDCYGIDMSRLGNFVAFRAAVELLKETNQNDVLDKVYEECLQEQDRPVSEARNIVKQIYEPFSQEEVSQKIAEIVKPSSIQAEVEVIYQSIEDLHKACPEHRGDWYFSGNYPTPGGNKVVNNAYINYIEGKKERAY